MIKAVVAEYQEVGTDEWDFFIEAGRGGRIGVDDVVLIHGVCEAVINKIEVFSNGQRFSCKRINKHEPS